MRRGIHFLVAIAALSFAVSPVAAQSVATPLAIEAANVAAVHASSFGAYLHLQGSTKPGDAGQGYFAYTGKVCADDGGATALKDVQGNCFSRLPNASQQVYVDQFKLPTDADDSPALTRAKAWAEGLGGGNLLLAGRVYNISSEFDIGGTFSLCLIGQSPQSTILNLTASNATAIRFVSSVNCAREIGFTTTGTGNVAVKFAPANESSTAAGLIENSNVLSHFQVRGTGFTNAIVLRNAGPVAGGGETYFNHIEDGDINAGCSVCVWWENSVAGTAGAGNGANNTYVSNVNVYGTGTTLNNCFRLDQSSISVLQAVSCEGDQFGASPAGIYIAQSDLQGGDNNANKINPADFEANTLDYYVGNVETVGIGIIGNAAQFPNGYPKIWESYSPSAIPSTIGCWADQAGSQNPLWSNDAATQVCANGIYNLSGNTQTPNGYTFSVEKDQSLANGANFTLAVPFTRAPYLLTVSNNANNSTTLLARVITDGGAGSDVTTFVNTANVTVTMSGSTLTITNASGIASHVYATLMQIGPRAL